MTQVSQTIKMFGLDFKDIISKTLRELAPNWAGNKVGPIYWIYYLCYREYHYKVSVPIFGSPRESWPSCKKQEPCDGTCVQGGDVRIDQIPWCAQQELGISTTVPTGQVLVEQRYAHDRRPYFKVWDGGGRVNTSQLELGCLLGNNETTVVCIAPKTGNWHGNVKVFSIRNIGGKSNKSFLGKVTNSPCNH